MKLLTILIKEKNIQWQIILAETAEAHTASNTRQSSYFHNDLAEKVNIELEKRCIMYLENSETDETEMFEVYFDEQSSTLRNSISSRFGIFIQENESILLTKAKYTCLLEKQSHNFKKDPIGFHVWK